MGSTVWQKGPPQSAMLLVRLVHSELSTVTELTVHSCLPHDIALE